MMLGGEMEETTALFQRAGGWDVRPLVLLDSMWVLLLVKMPVVGITFPEYMALVYGRLAAQRRW